MCVSAGVVVEGGVVVGRVRTERVSVEFVGVCCSAVDGRGVAPVRVERAGVDCLAVRCNGVERVPVDGVAHLPRALGRRGGIRGVTVVAAQPRRCCCSVRPGRLAPSVELCPAHRLLVVEHLVVALNTARVAEPLEDVPTDRGVVIHCQVIA